METIVKEKYHGEKVTFANGISGTQYTFEVEGQTPERSIEDRDVFFKVNTGESMWLRGEDAIQLGELLVRHGRKALVANMIQHQAIWARRKLLDWAKEGRINALFMTLIDRNPPNYGKGYHVFHVTPLWNEKMAPEYEEDFDMDIVKYWSPFDEEYRQELQQWIVPIIFVNYDHYQEVKEFNELINEAGISYCDSDEQE